MVVSRLFVVALALAVSPAGAAVCEVACGLPVHAAAHTVPSSSAAVANDSHSHHHQADPEGSVTASAPAAFRVDALPEADCQPVNAAPARIRGAFSDTPAPADPGIGAPLAQTAIVAVGHADVMSPPSSPPHHAPVPLRI